MTGAVTATVCTSARIVFYLNLMSWHIFWCFSANSDAMDMWEERNKCLRAQCKSWLPLCVWQLRPRSCPCSWNTIYNTCGVWWFDKNCKVIRIYEISSSATTDFTLHREWFGHDVFFLQLCQYISMTYSINGGMSEHCSTHEKTGDMDYTRVTNSKGCVDSRVLGSSAMH